MIKQDDFIATVHRINGYVVLEASDKFLHLMCTEFFAKEDLGDGIFCTGAGQKIWIARYFEPKFKIISN